MESSRESEWNGTERKGTGNMDERLRKVTLEFIQIVLETKPENYQEIKVELLQRVSERPAAKKYMKNVFNIIDEYIR